MNESTDLPISQRSTTSAPVRWVIEFGERMARRGDVRREKLLYFAWQALEAREDDPQRALDLYNDGRAEAETLREPWWVLFFDYLRLQIVTGPLGDYNLGRDIVLRAAVEVRKPVYAQFPQRICLHEDLIRVHLGIDPEGYERMIEDGIVYMEQELTPGSSCHECLQGVKSRFAIEMGRWDQAREELIKSLAMCDYKDIMPPVSGRHLVAQKMAAEKNRAAEYTQLCLVAWHQQDYESLRTWAAEGVEIARLAEQPACAAECLLWQALLTRRDGNEAAAQRLCYNALQEAKRSPRIPAREYYDALCTFHEGGGDLRQACQARANQLNLLRGKGQTFVEVHAHIERCRLLGQLGHSLDKALPAARAAANALVKPAAALEQLDRIERNAR